MYDDTGKWCIRNLLIFMGAVESLTLKITLWWANIWAKKYMGVVSLKMTYGVKNNRRNLV